MTETQDLAFVGNVGQKDITRKTRLVTFLRIDKDNKNIIVSRKAVNPAGAFRYFTLTFRLEASAWKKLRQAERSGSLKEGIMLKIVTEQRWEGDHHCDFMMDFDFAQ